MEENWLSRARRSLLRWRPSEGHNEIVIHGIEIVEDGFGKESMEIDTGNGLWIHRGKVSDYVIEYAEDDPDKPIGKLLSFDCTGEGRNIRYSNPNIVDLMRCKVCGHMGAKADEFHDKDICKKCWGKQSQQTL